MYQRFYSRYHPKAAYKNKVYRVAQKKDYHFSYLIDVQVMFHPALSSGRLLHRIIFSFEDVTREEKERHFGFLKDFIWGTITSLAERVAYSMLSTHIDGGIGSDDDSPLVPEVPQAKKQRFEGPTLALLETLIAPSAAVQPETGMTPNEMARKEVEYYCNIPKEQWPKFEETIVWWQSRLNRENMPCLSQVAAALLACKPSSGGLECDFGLLKDVIKAKRASLGQGFVEVEMMLKLNKHMFISCPEKVVTLPNDRWEEYIPKRPIVEGDDATDGEAEADVDADEAVDSEVILEVDEEPGLGTITSNSDDDLSLVGGFQADEYGDIVADTQPALTDSQESTYRVFDPDETQLPGRLD